MAYRRRRSFEEIQADKIPPLNISQFEYVRLVRCWIDALFTAVILGDSKIMEDGQFLLQNVLVMLVTLPTVFMLSWVILKKIGQYC